MKFKVKLYNETIYSGGYHSSMLTHDIAIADVEADNEKEAVRQARILFVNPERGLYKILEKDGNKV